MLLRSWSRATALGWLAGLVLVVGLAAPFLVTDVATLPGWWIAASLAGWPLASGLTMLAEPASRSLGGLRGALVDLGIVAVGGIVLGIVTGFALDRGVHAPPRTATPTVID